MPVVIPFFFGFEKAGIFFLVYKVIAFPVGVIGQSLGNILRRELIVESLSGKEARNIISKTFLLSLSISVLFFYLVYFFFDWVVYNYFGLAYLEALDILVR